MSACKSEREMDRCPGGYSTSTLASAPAVKGALTRFASTLVEDELKACLYCCDDPQEQEERIDRLTRILATMLKQG